VVHFTLTALFIAPGMIHRFGFISLLTTYLTLHRNVFPLGIKSSKRECQIWNEWKFRGQGANETCSCFILL